MQALEGQGLRLRQYRVAAGGSVQCTIGAQDDFVLGRLEVPLEVLVLPAAAPLRKKPAHVERVRLVSVEEGARRALGEYTFLHTPR